MTALKTLIILSSHFLGDITRQILGAIGLHRSEVAPISMSPSYVGDTSLPASMANMGQDIGRAVSAKMGPQERVNATLGALQIERAQLENDVLRQQLRSHSAAGTPPGIAGATVVPGAGDAPVIEITPPTRTPYVTRGDGSFMKTSPMMDAQVAENRYGDALQEAFGLRAFLEDFFPAQINWFDSQVYDESDDFYIEDDDDPSSPYEMEHDYEPISEFLSRMTAAEAAAAEKAGAPIPAKGMSPEAPATPVPPVQAEPNSATT